MLCLKGICTALSEQDFCAIAQLQHLQELVLDCEQPPEAEEGVEEIKWGLQTFPEGMLHLTNMTHLTLTCHYGITQLPAGLSKLNKLEVCGSKTKTFHVNLSSLPNQHSACWIVGMASLRQCSAAVNVCLLDCMHCSAQVTTR